MTNSVLPAIVAFGLVVAHTSAVSAQQQNCDAALVLQTSSQVTQTSYQLHWLSLVDEESFNQLKRNVDIGATFPVEGIPINGYADYAAFDQARRRYLAQQSYSTSFSDARSALAIYLHPEQLTAWLECKRIQTHGLTTYIQNPSATSVTVVIGWQPAPEGARPARLAVTVSGGQIVGSTPARIKVNAKVTVLVRRAPNEDFRLIVNETNGNTDEAFLPAAMPTVQPPQSSLRDRRARASWVYISPRNPGWTTIGTVEANETRVFEAGGSFVCHTPRPDACTVPVSGNSSVLIQPTNGQPARQEGYSAIKFITGPAVVAARIDDAVDSGFDNGDPPRPEDRPAAALY
jgi:hypothetical protein